MNLFKLVGSVYVDTDKANESIHKTSKNADSLSAKIGNGLSSAAKVGAVGLAACSTAVVAVGAAALEAGKEIYELTDSVAQVGDNIDKQSQKFGISAKAYQEWDAVMQHSGTSMESMGTSFKTLANATQSTTKAQGEAFKRLGLNVEELKGMKTEEVFGKVIEKLQGMEEGTERTALASKLLGRGGQQLGALLNTSAEDTQKMIDKVNELGGVMSDEAVKDSAAYEDALQDMNTAIDGVKNKLGAEFLPVFTKVFDTVQAVFTGGDWKDGALDVFNALGEAFSNIGDKFNQYAPKVFEAISGIIQDATEMLPQMLPEITSKALDFIDSLLTNVEGQTEDGGFVDLMSNLFRALADAMENAYPILLDEMPGIIEKFYKAFRNIIKKMGPLASDLIKQLGSMLVLYAPELMKVVGTLASQMGQTLVAEFVQVVKGLAGVIGGAWKGIMNSVYINPLNALVDKFNGMLSSLNKVPGVKMSKIGHIPQLAKGGEITGGGYAVVGEAGAELINMPSGATVTPLNSNNNAFVGMESLLQQMNENIKALGNMQVVMDSGELVGATATKTNKALGNINSYGMRGVYV